MAERVCATFESERLAERAVAALVDAGVDVEAITVVVPAGPEGGSAVTDATMASEGDPQGRERDDGIAVGALLGLGAVNAGTGGVGTAAGVQPLAAGAGGVIAGSLLGAAYEGLLHAGLDEETARLYERRLQAGSSIVVVRSDRLDPSAIRGILEKHGGADLRGGEPFTPLV